MCEYIPVYTIFTCIMKLFLNRTPNSNCIYTTKHLVKFFGFWKAPLGVPALQLGNIKFVTVSDVC